MEALGRVKRNNLDTKSYTQELYTLDINHINN